ncbi:MAG: glycoside hydrolase family 25 protein [Lachnospiraceae bacterium]|nr:glycoside hydrolase family 25 protein [Lachnospiraceae bacterium]
MKYLVVFALCALLFTSNKVAIDNISQKNNGYIENDIEDEDYSEKVFLKEDDTNNPDNRINDVDEYGDTLLFRDVFGEEYECKINHQVPKKIYKDENFIYDGELLRYEDDEYTSRLGIDVSSFQGNVNYEKVKNAGFDFVIIRCGYRGYGNAGNLKQDKQFENNITKAKEAGLDVGVYIYSQAINEGEAIEEAEFVLKLLNGRELELPIVYDPESVLDDVARTDDVTPEQFTKNSVAFCDRIKKSGYDVMIYSNMLWEAFQLDLSQLPKVPVWYADYETYPQTCYDFEFWQYSNTGRVPGIDGETDLDIQIIRK